MDFNGYAHGHDRYDHHQCESEPSNNKPDPPRSFIQRSWGHGNSWGPRGPSNFFRFGPPHRHWGSHENRMHQQPLRHHGPPGHPEHERFGTEYFPPSFGFESGETDKRCNIDRRNNNVEGEERFGLRGEKPERTGEKFLSRGVTDDGRFNKKDVEKQYEEKKISDGGNVTKQEERSNSTSKSFF